MLGPQGMTLLDSPDAYALPVPNPDLPEVPVPTVSSGGLEPIPRVGLPDLDEGDMEVLGSMPIPGFIIIPADIAFLNQLIVVHSDFGDVTGNLRRNRNDIAPNIGVICVNPCLCVAPKAIPAGQGN